VPPVPVQPAHVVQRGDVPGVRDRGEPVDEGRLAGILRSGMAGEDLRRAQLDFPRVVLSVACTLLLLPIAMSRGAIGGQFQTVFDFMVPTIVELAMLAAAGCALVGLWWFTAPEPKPIGQASDLDRRRMVRFLGCASLVALAAISMLSEQTAAGSVLRHVAVMLVMAWCAAVLLYIRRLALRIPNDQEARTAKKLFIGFLIAVGVTALSAVASFGGPGKGHLADLLGCGSFVGLVLFTAYIVLLNRFRRILNDIAENVRKADGANNSAEGSEQKTGA
jgi:hypothetical protein